MPDYVAGTGRNNKMSTIDELLLKDVNKRGFLYFVQYDNKGKYEYSSEKTKAVHTWLKDNNIRYAWIGGRANYEIAFMDEESACLFKMIWGI